MSRSRLERSVGILDYEVGPPVSFFFGVAWSSVAPNLEKNSLGEGDMLMKSPFAMIRSHCAYIYTHTFLSIYLSIYIYVYTYVYIHTSNSDSMKSPITIFPYRSAAERLVPSKRLEEVSCSVG